MRALCWAATNRRVPSADQLSAIVCDPVTIRESNDWLSVSISVTLSAPVVVASTCPGPGRQLGANDELVTGRGRGAVPSAAVTHSLLAMVKAMRLPSGDHTG